MSEKNEQNNTPDDDYDEELISLSGPPPSLRMVFFTVLILGLSITMLGWFYPETRYLSAMVTGQKDLGEAADLDMKTLQPDTYAKIRGFPMNRALTFTEGVRWFTFSDNSRRFFPLAGQPNLFVQWQVPDEHKAYRSDATNPVKIGPPSHFEGHLRRRADMGPNYERVWIFFDCLKYHYLGRCNQCLGRTSLDECRERFVCTENNDPEQCSQITGRSMEQLDAQIATIEKGAKGPDDQKKISDLRIEKARLREHHINVAATQLEEFGIRGGQLRKLAKEANDPRVDDIDTFLREIAALRVQELAVRGIHATRAIEVLSPAELNKIEASISETEKLKKEQAALKAKLQILQPVGHVYDELARLINRGKALRKKAAIIDGDKLTALSSWDPNTKDGKILFNAYAALESAVADIENAAWRKAHPQDGGVDGPSESAADAGVEEKDADDKWRPTPKPAMLKHPAFVALKEKLSAVESRAKALLSVINQFSPGDNAPFEKWAGHRDVQGSVPEALRGARVINAIAELETMLLKGAFPVEKTLTEEVPEKLDSQGEKVTVEAAPIPVQKPSLIKRINQTIDTYRNIEKTIAQNEKMPGLIEYQIYQPLKAVKKAVLSLKTEKDIRQIFVDIDKLVQQMTLDGHYLMKLRGSPAEMGLLEAITQEKTVEDLASRLDDLSTGLEQDDWVLIDGEIPLDKLWIVLVYLVLGFMIVVNLRKLWRFWLAYKE